MVEEDRATKEPMQGKQSKSMVAVAQPRQALTHLMRDSADILAETAQLGSCGPEDQGRFRLKMLAHKTKQH